MKKNTFEEAVLAQMFIYSIFGNTMNETRKTQCGGDVMTVYWILSLTRAFPLAHTGIRNGSWKQRGSVCV